MPTAQAGEPAAWDEAADYWWWLEKFGLDPDRVDSLPAHLYARIPWVDEVAVEVREEQQRREAG